MPAFAAAFAAARGERPEPGLENSLACAYDAGAKAFPVLSVDPEAYVRHVAGLLPRSGDVGAGLASIHASDVYLAVACAGGDEKALRIFDETHLARLPQLLGRIRLAPEAVDELRQQLREHLMLPRANKPPRIAEYGGKAPLSSWIRVAAMRLALNLRRGEKRAERVADAAEATVAIDPEIAAIRRRFGADFNDALRSAFTSLEPRERNLLRLHYVDRLGIDALAPVLSVSRATAARHLAAARDALVERTTRNLRDRLRLAAPELESLLRQVRSKLEISLSGLLKTG
ncbi:MAG: sigma-70 family RNA polymerase sigma factor [Myxococcales bacterium]|nr:sigma-70 family RNA polymerase sigma factor [Myxococcales bacterium]